MSKKGQRVERDRLEMEGLVVEASNGMFKVDIGNGFLVLATLSGRIRQNSVKVLLGDKVLVEIGQMDPTRGRIVFRLK